jgi:hypothetical protein
MKCPPLAVVLLAVVLVSCGAQPSPAQEAKTTAQTQPAKAAAAAPVLTDGQHEADRLRLREPQLMFFAAQKDMQLALDQFYAVCSQMVTDEKWPKGTQCNINNLAVTLPAPAEVQTPAKK